METADEFFHRPTAEEYWSESHYLDFAGETLQGYVRIGFYPNRDLVSVWAYLLDGEAVYWVDAETVPPAATHGLVVRTDDWTFEMTPDGDGAWTVTWAGTATRSTAPADVLAGRGETADVDVEFTSVPRHDCFRYSEGETWPQDGDADRYEVASRVAGTAVLDGEAVSFDAPGERDHSWGPRRWAGDAEWLWISGAFEDGTAYNHMTAWLTEFPDDPFVNGFWYDGESVAPITDAAVDATPAFGRETARDWSAGAPPTVDLHLEWAGGATTVTIEPFATTPLDFVAEDRDQRALFNRSVARQETAEGVAGAGWLENPTQFDRD
ncbi:MAG: hypothetical protein ABEJ23_08455 [Haloarculaceae archaeon]